MVEVRRCLEARSADNHQASILRKFYGLVFGLSEG